MDLPPVPVKIQKPTLPRPPSQRSVSMNIGESPVAAAADNEPEGLAGYMFKQGPKENLMKRRWHKRWFYQRKHKLFYYKCKGDQLEKGCIDMELCTDFRKIDSALVLEVSPRPRARPSVSASTLVATLFLRRY